MYTEPLEQFDTPWQDSRVLWLVVGCQPPPLPVAVYTDDGGSVATSIVLTVATNMRQQDEFSTVKWTFLFWIRYRKEIAVQKHLMRIFHHVLNDQSYFYP